MKPNLRALSKTATNVLCPLFVIACLLPAIGCGDGGGDGAEDTGSILHASAVAADEGGRNVDTTPDDTDDDGLIDNFLTDTQVTITFTNTSVVPEQNTATTLRVESYTIDYSTTDPTAPPLSSRTFGANFIVEPDQTVERGDILLVSLATVDEYNAGVAGGAVPTDDPTEYTAHYTFHVENVPFGESQTVTANVAFSVGNFLPAN
ncbi:MAG TPA: hypothetical protein VGB12_02205 [bacterium]